MLSSLDYIEKLYTCLNFGNMSVHSGDVGVDKSKIMLGDHANNDSSSVSASISNNEDSLDSDSNERCVVDDGVIKQTLTAASSSLLGSDDDSDKTIPTNDKYSVRKAGRQGKPNSVTNENKPLFSISFRNQAVARKYKNAIKKFLKDLIAHHDPDTEEYDTSDLELDMWEEQSNDSDDDVQIEDSSLFQVDTRPTMKDELDVPTYTQNCREVLKEVEKDNEKKKENLVSRPSSCFNCMGSHSLRDCPHPRNASTIANNRRQFANRHGSQTKTSRYHMDDEQRFANFVPGQISNKLSKALGLSKHRLPRHIYRMRLLGYPPGWLEDAKISHSGLALYDSQGKEVAEPDTEEGEIIMDGSRDKFDINKIISYPGFNIPCSPGTIDEYEYHRCPPQNSDQSKERMLLDMGQNTMRAYKRKRLAPTPTAAKPIRSDEDLTQADMEVEVAEPGLNLLPPDDNCRFIPPLPKDTPPRPPPPPSTESDSEGGESRSQGVASPLSTGQSGMSSPRAQSPSLSDLETRKQLLLAELEDGGSSSDTTLKAPLPTTPKPSTSTLGKVKLVELGTPILQSASPYSRLPKPEKFSRDICDVINFENLPDSTGKYEKMNDLLRKVRTVVTRIQQEDDECDGGK